MSRVAGLIALAVQPPPPSPRSKSIVDVGPGCVGRRRLRVGGARIDRLVGVSIPRILKHFALGRGVEQVGVGRDRVLRCACRFGDRDLVLLGPGDQARCGWSEVPERATGAITLMCGIERIGGKLEADLVVALAGGAVGNRIGAGLVPRSRPAAWKSAAGRSRCRADTSPSYSGHWRASSGRRNRGRTPRCMSSDVDVVVGLTPISLAFFAGRLEFLALAEIGG